MFPSSTEIIDLSSDSEDDIVFAKEDDIIDLCSDNEDNSDLRSGRTYDLDNEDADNYFYQPLVSLSTFDQKSVEPVSTLESEDSFSSPEASSSYRPAENKSTNAMSSEMANIFPPVNHGSSVGMPHDSGCGNPKDQCIDDVKQQNVCNDDKRTLPLLLANDAAAKSEHFNDPNDAPPDSAHAIPSGQCFDNVRAPYVCNDNKRTLPLLLTNGAPVKPEHSYVPYHARLFPQSFTSGIPRNFSPQPFAFSHSSLGDHRIKEEHTDSRIKEEPTENRIKEELTDNRIKEEPIDNRIKEEPTDNRIKEETIDNRIKEEPTVKYNGVQRCAANGNGMSSSTVFTGPRSHRIFPPPRPFGTSVNGTEVDIDAENRLFGFNERAVYEEALKHISQEKKEEDLPEGVMSVSLLKHQRIALAWMVSKERSLCSGGILADDQGLGKTISTIALIQKERVQQSRFMTADTSCMKSVLNVDDDDDDIVIIMENKEMKNENNKLDGSTPFHVGSSLELCTNRSMATADRMVKIAKVELGKKPRLIPSKSKTRPAAGTLVVCPASVLKQWANELSVKVTESSKLSVLVYYGASRTRNPTELAKYDVVVTTYTTVANEVPKDNPDDEQKNSEYGICPELSVGSKRKEPPITTKPDGGPLARVRWFRVVLDEAQTIKNYRTQVARACSGLSAERRWCLSGTPIQNKIEDLYSYFCFLKFEPYSKFASFSCMIKNPISRDPARGYKKLQAILRIILLRRTKETLIDGEPIIKLPPKTIELSKLDFTLEERAFYLALEEGSRQKFKAYDAAGTIRDNYANILVLLLRLRQACDHPILLKGQESDLIDNTSIERAKQLPKDTVTNMLEKLETGPVICSICSDPPEDVVVATCGHVFCYQCVHERLTSDDNVCPSLLCGKKISTGSVFSPAVLKLFTLPKLESDVATSLTPAEESSSICESSYVSSKIKAAIDIINSIISTRAITEGGTVKSIPSEIAPVKAIVFSQWTGMLDLLELSLSSNHIEYRRLDGKMSLNIRDRAVKEFNTIPEVKVMIMSLKAGNLGLNMVAASHVIMLDPWWNPYAEDQAVDRAHRIGQTRPVTVSRLTVKGTVEDRILALQEKKRKMVESAFGEDKSSGNASRLTVEDLRYLFMV